MPFERDTMIAASIATLLAACGGGNSNRPAEGNTGPQEISFEATPVHRSDTEGPEAPPTGTELSQSVRRAINARHADIAHCYDTVLRTTPEAVGRISIDMALNASGGVERVEATSEGEGGIGVARACIETTLRGVHVDGVPAGGARVRYAYSFANPPVEITAAAPFAIASRRPPANRAHPAPAPAPAPAATATGDGGTASDASAPAGPGVLTESDIAPVVSEKQPELNACYATVLRTARGAAGTATLNFTIGGDGAVTESALADAQPPLSNVGECINGVIRGLHFRASGTAANVHMPLTFAR